MGMNSKSGNSLLVSVDDDSEEIMNSSVLGGLGNRGESKVRILYNELLYDVVEEGAEYLNSVISPPMEMDPAEIKSEVSPSPPATVTRKGYGLKKWRRIKRDVSKVGESSVDSGKMVMQELPDSIVHRSKRTQVYAEKQQKSEGSVSSSIYVARRLDDFTILGDPGMAMASPLDSGTCLVNGEDFSSKPLTTTGFPTIRNEMPIVVEQNLVHSLQNGKGKGLIEAVEKTRGARLKIKKETSRSSVESDSHSSSFVFVKGPNVTSNEIHCDRPVEHQRSKQQVRNGYGGENEVKVPKEKTEELASSSNQDLLVESIFLLKTAQEALEKEVLKFKEIRQSTSVKYLVLDAQPEFRDVGAKFQETSSRQLPSSEGLRDFPQTTHSEMVEIETRDVLRELEKIIVQRIEAEVEYMVLSIMVQKQRVGAVDESIYLKQQKAAFSEQRQILYKSGDKTALFKKESWKRENLQGIAGADETLKLQNRVCVHTSYFFLQLLLLLLILGVFIFQFSPDYVDVVPT